MGFGDILKKVAGAAVPGLGIGLDVATGLLSKGAKDEAGEAASCQMISRHSSIKRLPPPAHDWNDALRASN